MHSAPGASDANQTGESDYVPSETACCGGHGRWWVGLTSAASAAPLAPVAADTVAGATHITDGHAWRQR